MGVQEPRDHQVSFWYDVNMSDQDKDAEITDEQDFIPSVDVVDLEKSTESQEQEKYSPEYVGRLFFDSFRFSQGSPGVQKYIFQYLSRHFGDRLTPELIQQGVEKATPRIEGFVSGGKHVTGVLNTADFTIRREKEKWIEVLNDEQAQVEIPDLLVSILKSDSSYGRRIRQGDYAAKHSRSDAPRLSQFVFYGLLGRTTGMPEYDAMFAELVDKLPDVPVSAVEKDGGNSYELSLIVGNHFAAYPDDLTQITPQGLAALQESLDADTLKGIGFDSV